MQWTLDQGTLVPTDEERWRYEEEFLEERERQRERQRFTLTLKGTKATAPSS